MSSIIRLLPDHIANQIAAGEVIQRPASVVKELIENSIDAGATSIEVVIKDSGRTLIQVTDNGKGMSVLDARMCFERHATSKIQLATDLFQLTTKGFRGEALATVAAIAHVTLKTRQADAELGTEIIVEGTQIKDQQPIQFAVGTSFEVKNIFYNIPARRKFLKTDNAEFNHILAEFERVVLAHSNLSFKLFHNGTEIYHLVPSPTRKRIIDVFGRKYDDKLVPVNEATSLLKIEGFVGKPEVAKRTRGEQFLFVNNRYFVHKNFNFAVSSAFEQLLPAKVFPSYFLFLEVDPDRIDVNVSPTKTSINFEDENAIFSMLRTAIRTSLGKFNITETLDFDRETAFDLPLSMSNQPAYEPQVQVDRSYNPFVSTEKTRTPSFSSAIQEAGFGTKKSTNSSDWNQFWDAPEIELPNENTLPFTTSLDEGPELVEGAEVTGPFIIKGSFVVGSSPTGLLVIHGRRAHERMLYEDMMRGFYVNPLGSQQLLFPFEKSCSKQEKMVWEEHSKTLERIGFTWNWEVETMHISGIPELLTESTLLACVDRMLEQLQMGELDKGEIAHTVLSHLAFAGSMSLKLVNDQDAIASFVTRLFETKEHQFTPGGKRIISVINNEHIFQLFA